MWLIGAFFLLLMLSALIETPAAEETGVVPSEPTAIYHAELLPYVVPMAEHSAITPSQYHRLLGAVVLCSILAALPACSCSRDANGRWVRGKRYVHSAYQVFRQDVAGG